MDIFDCHQVCGMVMDLSKCKSASVLKAWPILASN
jgi:hypothetical protein